MTQCVPSWDLQDINPDQDVFKSLDYDKVAELTWENGQLGMHEMGHRRVPSKSQPTTSWEKPCAAETLEAIVNQAYYCKPQVIIDDDELVPLLHQHQHQHQHTPTVAVGSGNASATMTSDALVPTSKNQVSCSTRVGSCSGGPSAFVSRTVAPCGGDWSSYRDYQSVSENGTYEYDTELLGGRRLSSENTSSAKDCSKSTFPDDSFCEHNDTESVKEKKKGRGKPCITNKRRRTAAVHNQSERKRRDKINEKMKTLQKMVPYSSKIDKASMLDEIIEHVKQLQAQLHMMNTMNMSTMMMPLAMQQQMQMSMMSSMGIGLGMGMTGIDVNTISRSNIPIGFHPSFMHMPSWNGHASMDRVVNTTTIANNPMSAFLACRFQPMTMDAYCKMAALYQHMQNQPSTPLPRN